MRQRIVRLILSFVVVSSISAGCGEVPEENIASVASTTVAPSVAPTSLPAASAARETDWPVHDAGTIVAPAVNSEAECQRLADFLLEPVLWDEVAPINEVAASFHSAVTPLGREASEVVTTLFDLRDEPGDEEVAAAMYAQLERISVARCGWPFSSVLFTMLSAGTYGRFCEIAVALDGEEPPPTSEPDPCVDAEPVDPTSLPCFMSTGIPFSLDEISYEPVDCETQGLVYWDPLRAEWVSAYVPVGGDSIP